MVACIFNQPKILYSQIAFDWKEKIGHSFDSYGFNPWSQELERNPPSRQLYLFSRL